MAAPVILVEATPRQSADGTPVTVRLAGGGAQMPYHYGDQHWQAGVSGLPRSSASLDFDGEQLGGGGSGEAIEVSWAPSTKSALAAIADLYWTDAPITVRVGPEGTDLPAIATTGLVMETAVDTGVFKIALGDQAADLKRPLLVDRFAGTGGLEGPPEFADLIKSRAWGRCFNVPGRQLDAAHNIWCFGDPWHRWLSFDAIRDKGVSASAATLTVLDAQASPDATFQALQAAPVLPGGAVLCPSIACVKWWTTPAGDLHADIRGEISGGYVETAPEIVARLVAARSTIPFGDGAIAAAAASRPAPFGWRVDTDSATAAGEISEILGGVSTSWLLVDGAIVFRHWDWTVPTRVARSFAVTRKSSVKPTASRKLGYRRNWAPMARGDLAAIVLVQDVAYEDGTPIADAIDNAGKTADWNKVTGDDKPENNATVGGTIGVNIGVLDGLLPTPPSLILNDALELTPAGQLQIVSDFGPPMPLGYLQLEEMRLELTPAGRLQYSSIFGDAIELGDLKLETMGLELTPAGQLQYHSALGEIVQIGALRLEDLGAASAASARQLHHDLDLVSAAVQTALNEASRTRAIFTDAGFTVDPATGTVVINAIQQTEDALSEVAVRLSAAESLITLRATRTYVDNAIASAVLDPSQVPIFGALEVRISSAEVSIDALGASINSLATNVTVDALGARVTTAESSIDALNGEIVTKVDTTDFDALGARVSDAETSISSFGGSAAISSAISVSRSLLSDTDAGAKSALSALLNGDLAGRTTLDAIATARQELTAKITDDVSAESNERLALAARVGASEAQAISETQARVDAIGVLVTQLTSLSAILDTTGAAVDSEAVARAAADGTLTAGLADNVALSRTLGRSTAAAAESALTALLAGDLTNRTGGGALAAAREELTAKINGDVDVVVQRVTALLARMGASEASLVVEQAVRAAGDSALAQSIVTLNAAVGDNAAAIGSANVARVDGDKALADRIDTMSARVGDAEAAARNETQTRTDGDTALAGELDQLTSRVGDAEANATSDRQARIDGDGALARDLDTLGTRVGDAEATATTDRQARVDGDQALSGEIDQLTARVDDSQASVETERLARVAADGTLSAGLADTVALSRTLGGNTGAAAQSALAALLTGDAAKRTGSDALAAARDELTAKINGDVDVVVQRVFALLARVGASEATLVVEQAVRAAGDSALSQLIVTLNAAVGDNAAAIGSANVARVDGDKALSDRLDTMGARVGDAEAAARSETQTRIDGDGALAGAIGELTGRVGSAEASVQAEQIARAAADGILSAGLSENVALSRTQGGNTAAAAESALTALLNGDTAKRAGGDALAAARDELTAKINGDVDVVVQRVTALLARMGAAEASLVVEQAVRAAGDSALSQSILALNAAVGDNTAAIGSANVARVDGDKALADSIDTMSARVGDAEAATLHEVQARSDGDTVLAGEIDQLSGRVGDAEATATRDRQARIDGDGALSIEIDQLSGRVGNAEATATRDRQARVDGDGVLSSEIDQLSGRVGDSEATATRDRQARIDGDGALSSEIDQLNTRVGTAEVSVSRETQARIDSVGAVAADVQTLRSVSEGHTSELRIQAESIGGVQARYGLRLDVNGHVTGFVANDDGVEGVLTFVFDKTQILRPDGTLLFRAGNADTGEDPNAVYMPNVVVDRLKINAAVIPAFVSMSGLISGPGWSDPTGDGGSSGGGSPAGPIGKDLG